MLSGWVIEAVCKRLDPSVTCRFSLASKLVRIPDVAWKRHYYAIVQFEGQSDFLPLPFRSFQEAFHHFATCLRDQHRFTIKLLLTKGLMPFDFQHQLPKINRGVVHSVVRQTQTGYTIYVASYNKTVTAWKDGKEVAKTTLANIVNSMQLVNDSAGRQMIAVSVRGSELEIFFDVDKLQKLDVLSYTTVHSHLPDVSQFIAHRTRITEARNGEYSCHAIVSGSVSLVVIGTLLGIVEVWDLKTQSFVRKFKTSSKADAITAIHCPHLGLGSLVILGFMNDTFRVFDLHTGTSVFQWQGSLLSRTPTQITSVRDNIIVQYEHRSISVYAPRLQAGSVIDLLPSEIVREILFYVYPKDNCSFGAISRRCRDIANAPALWKCYLSLLNLETRARRKGDKRKLRDRDAMPPKHRFIMEYKILVTKNAYEMLTAGIGSSRYFCEHQEWNEPDCTRIEKNNSKIGERSFVITCTHCRKFVVTPRYPAPQLRYQSTKSAKR